MEAPRRGSYARRGNMLVRLDFILLSRHLQHDFARHASLLIPVAGKMLAVILVYFGDNGRENPQSRECSDNCFAM